MTKELELFKRWIGKTHLKIGGFGGVEISLLKPIVILYFNGCGYFSKKEMQDLLSNKCFHGVDVKQYKGNIFYNYKYDIPSQYHTEWEQYVKENKK